MNQLLAAVLALSVGQTDLMWNHSVLPRKAPPLDTMLIGPRLKHASTPYEVARAEAVRRQVPLVVGVDCEPPIGGDWVTARVNGPVMLDRGPVDNCVMVARVADDDVWIVREQDCIPAPAYSAHVADVIKRRGIIKKLITAPLRILTAPIRAAAGRSVYGGGGYSSPMMYSEPAMYSMPMRSSGPRMIFPRLRRSGGGC